MVASDLHSHSHLVENIKIFFPSCALQNSQYMANLHLSYMTIHYHHKNVFANCLIELA